MAFLLFINSVHTHLKHNSSMLLQAIRNCSKAIELDPEYLKVKCYLNLSLLVFAIFTLFLQKQMNDKRSHDFDV